MPELSPNGRGHWSKLAKAKAAYRRECAALVSRQQRVAWAGCEGLLKIELYFFPPTARWFDLDNLLARMKAGIDGLADALAFNDRCIRRVEAVRCEPAGKQARVEVELRALGLVDVLL